MYIFLNYNESPTREKRRANIINRSMDIFIRDGIGGVTMTELAKEINVPYRSIYNYYQSKDELAVDIQLVALNKVFGGQYNEIQQPFPNYIGSKTAYEKLRDYIFRTYQLFMRNKKEVKYITAFDYYYFNEYPSEKYNQYLASIRTKDPLVEVLKHGKEDESINLISDNIPELSATIMQSIISYAQKVIFREGAMSLETVESRGNLETFLNIMLVGLKRN